MVNGATSRMVYVSVAVIVLVCLGGVIAAWLMGVTAETPELIKFALTGGITFLLGAHFKPPVNVDGNGKPLADDQRADGKAAGNGE